MWLRGSALTANLDADNQRWRRAGRCVRACQCGIAWLRAGKLVMQAASAACRCGARVHVDSTRCRNAASLRWRAGLRLGGRPSTLYGAGAGREPAHLVRRISRCATTTCAGRSAGVQTCTARRRALWHGRIGALWRASVTGLHDGAGLRPVQNPALTALCAMWSWMSCWRTADLYFSLHCPLTAEMHHIINADIIKMDA